MTYPFRTLRSPTFLLALLLLPASVSADADVQGLANRANTAMSEENWSEADDLLEQALARAPEAPELWIGRGFTRVQTERFPDARESFERALELYERRVEEEPDNPGLLMNVGYTLVLLNRRDDALAYLRAAAERVPDQPVLARFEEIIDNLEENFSEFILPEQAETGKAIDPASR